MASLLTPTPLLNTLKTLNKQPLNLSSPLCVSVVIRRAGLSLAGLARLYLASCAISYGFPNPIDDQHAPSTIKDDSAQIQIQ